MQMWTQPNPTVWNLICLVPFFKRRSTYGCWMMRKTLREHLTLGPPAWWRTTPLSSKSSWRITSLLHPNDLWKQNNSFYYLLLCFIFPVAWSEYPAVQFLHSMCRVTELIGWCSGHFLIRLQLNTFLKTVAKQNHVVILRWVNTISFKSVITLESIWIFYYKRIVTYGDNTEA